MRSESRQKQLDTMMRPDIGETDESGTLDLSLNTMVAVQPRQPAKGVPAEVIAKIHRNSQSRVYVTADYECADYPATVSKAARTDTISESFVDMCGTTSCRPAQNAFLCNDSGEAVRSQQLPLTLPSQNAGESENQGSMKASSKGSFTGSASGIAKGSVKGSAKGSVTGSATGSASGSDKGSGKGSSKSSQRSVNAHDAEQLNKKIAKSTGDEDVAEILCVVDEEDKVLSIADEAGQVHKVASKPLASFKSLLSFKIFHRSSGERSVNAADEEQRDMEVAKSTGDEAVAQVLCVVDEEDKVLSSADEADQGRKVASNPLASVKSLLSLKIFHRSSMSPQTTKPRERGSGVEVTLPDNPNHSVIITIPTDLIENVCEDGKEDGPPKDEDIEMATKMPRTRMLFCSRKRSVGIKLIALSIFLVGLGLGIWFGFFAPNDSSGGSSSVVASSSAGFSPASTTKAPAPKAAPSPAKSPRPSSVPSARPTPTPTVTPTNKPTAAPTSLEASLQAIIANASAESVYKSGISDTPQNKAFQYLLDNTEYSKHSNQRILQWYALAVLYHSTNGPNWSVDTNWLQKNDECSWFNMNPTPCSIPTHSNETKEILNLDLKQMGLSGTLPDELSFLSKLSVLILSDNEDLTGDIPTTLGKLEHLTVLELAYTGLSGELPSQLGDAKNLVRLDLTGTPVQGTVPDTFAQLTKLDILKLSNTAMEGNMSSAICAKKPSVVESNCFDTDATKSCPCCTKCCFPAANICV